MISLLRDHVMFAQNLTQKLCNRKFSMNFVNLIENLVLIL